MPGRDTDFKSIIPTLQGIDNYRPWLVRIRNALRARDPLLWQVASGEYALESYEPIVFTPAQIRTKAAAHFNAPTEAAVEADQIAQWTEEFIDTPNSELIRWEKLNARALNLITMTLHDRFMVVFQDEIHASSVMGRLKADYDFLTEEYYPVLYENFMSWKYKVGMNPSHFCCRFRELLRDLNATAGVSPKPSPKLVFCTFMTAVQAHGDDMMPWILSHNPDVETEDLLDQTIQSFLRHEYYRKRLNAIHP